MIINIAILCFLLFGVLFLISEKFDKLEYRVNQLEEIVLRLNGEKVERKNGITIITQEHFMEPS